MKKTIAMLLIALLTFSLISVAYADSDSMNKIVATDNGSNAIEPYGFSKTKTVKKVNDSEKTIIEDSNWYNETTVTCTWASSSGPTSVTINCYIKYNGYWSLYGTRTFTAPQDHANFQINGGEPFRITVIRKSGNDGDCTFKVTLG